MEKKKESRMGKLIGLLNEYVEKHNKSELYYTFELEEGSGYLFCYDDTTDHKGWTMQDESMVICSKKFGFIQRLCENKRINRKKDRYGIHLYKKGIQMFVDSYEMLIMELSIQDDPLKFLSKILN